MSAIGLKEAMRIGKWIWIAGSPVTCHIRECEATIPVGRPALKFKDGGTNFFYCEKCAKQHGKREDIPKDGRKHYMATGKAVTAQGVHCFNTQCKRAIHVGEFALQHHQGGVWWCKECWKKWAPKLKDIPPYYEREEEKRDLNPFETLSHNDKATAISKRFSISREAVLKWSDDRMLSVWKTGNQLDEKPIVGLSEKQVVDIASRVVDSKAPNIIKQARDGFAREIETLRAMIDIKREVEVVFPTGERKKVGKQHFKYEDVMKLIALRLNVWMAGPAGAGKTYLASEIAKALDRPFFRISCGPQTSASQIFGHTTAHGGYAPGIAYQAITHEKGCVLLFDEFDRLNPAVAVMVNGLLDGNAVTFPNGETIKARECDSLLVAANTFGKPTAEFGTAQRQDIATMSRFVKILIPVDEKLEMGLFGPINEDWVKFIQKVRKVVVQVGVTSLVVTPRASEYGVRMLAAGMERKTVEDMLLWNGVPSEDIKKIQANLK